MEFQFTGDLSESFILQSHCSKSRVKFMKSVPHLVHRELLWPIQFSVWSDRIHLEKEPNLVPAVQKVVVSDMVPCDYMDERHMDGTVGALTDDLAPRL